MGQLLQSGSEKASGCPWHEIDYTATSLDDDAQGTSEQLSGKPPERDEIVEPKMNATRKRRLNWHGLRPSLRILATKEIARSRAPIQGETTKAKNF